MIIATRNGRERAFSKRAWELMGPTKMGWVQVNQDLPELKESKVLQPDNTLPEPFPELIAAKSENASAASDDEKAEAVIQKKKPGPKPKVNAD